MSNQTFKIFVDKMGGSNLTSYMGNYGEIVYDPIIPVLKIADGVTPGAINLAFTQVSPIYAQLSSNTNQIPANTSSYAITYDTQDFISGFSHTLGGTRITVLFDGVYLIVAGGQISRGSGSGTPKDMDFWLRKNGINVPSSGVRMSLVNTNDTDVLILNYIIPLLANDYLELVQSVADATVGMGLTRYTGFSGGPSVPSIIFTITKVSG